MSEPHQTMTRPLPPCPALTCPCCDGEIENWCCACGYVACPICHGEGSPNPDCPHYLGSSELGPDWDGDGPLDYWTNPLGSLPKDAPEPSADEVTAAFGQLESLARECWPTGDGFRGDVWVAPISRAAIAVTGGYIVRHPGVLGAGLGGGNPFEVYFAPDAARSRELVHELAQRLTEGLDRLREPGNQPAGDTGRVSEAGGT